MKISVGKRGPRKFLNVIESWLRKSGRWDAPSPVFIVGSARTGSTLVYQCLTAAYRFSYFSNLLADHAKYPLTLATVSKFVGGCTPQTRRFVNKLGSTEGWRSPSQGYTIWQKWWPRGDDRQNGITLTAQQIDEIRSIVFGISKRYRRPFVNKWQGHVAHLTTLAEIFPNALFIHVQRSLVPTAVSVYRARMDSFGHPKKSISRVPRSYAEFASDDPVRQVCGYVLGVEEQLRDESQAIGNDRFYTIVYEDFCRAPQAVVDGFIQWYVKRSSFQVTKYSTLPKRFDVSNSWCEDKELVITISANLVELLNGRFACVKESIDERLIGEVLGKDWWLRLQER